MADDLAKLLTGTAPPSGGLSKRLRQRDNAGGFRSYLDDVSARADAAVKKRSEIKAINGLGDTREDAQLLDEHARIKKWIDDNPRAAAVAAIGVGGSNGLLGQAPATWLNYGGNITSQLRTSYPSTYRAANYGATAPWWLMGPAVGAGMTANAAYSDPIVHQVAKDSMKDLLNSEWANRSMLDVVSDGLRSNKP